MQPITATETKERAPVQSPATLSSVGTALSKDGTWIAFDRIGNGSPVILVDGALCCRSMGPSAPLAKLLAPRFTVFTYDRRGRGESSDTAPYAVEREVEDLEAVLYEAGGTAFVWGSSSGAVIALEAAKRLPGIKKLAFYEAPFIVDDSRATTQEDWTRIDEAIASGRRSDAVKFFMRMVGVPGIVLTVMQWLPVWTKLKAVAHTLPHDGALVQDYEKGRPLPPAQWAAVTVPALVMAGAKSSTWMRQGNLALANVLPHAKYRALDGQTHALKPHVHAPILAEFFKS